MPWFIDNRQLRFAVWLMAEAVTQPLIKRLDRIMTLVSIDDSVLASLTTLAQTVDTEVKALIAAGTLAPGDASGIQTALSDANDALTTASGTVANPPANPPVDGGDGTTPPADASGGDGTATS